MHEPYGTAKSLTGLSTELTAGIEDLPISCAGELLILCVHALQEPPVTNPNDTGMNLSNALDSVDSSGHI